MTTENQLLRHPIVLSADEVTHYATCCVTTEDAIRAAEQKILERALTQPAQPAEGGEAVYQIRYMGGSWADTTETVYRLGLAECPNDVRVLYAAPPASPVPEADFGNNQPASQEQAECAKAAHDALMTGTGFMQGGKHIPLDQVFADPPKGGQAQASAGGVYAIAYEWDEPGDCVHRSFRYYPRNGRYPDRSVKLYTDSQEQAQQPSGGEVARLAQVALDEAGSDPKPCDWMEAALKVCRHVVATPKPEPMTWQPIETAPKDGTRILLRGEHSHSVSYWWPYVWMPDTHNGVQKPTHWMPLPPAPITKEQAWG